MKLFRFLTFVVAALLFAPTVQAQITVPNTFVPQTRILSADVNDNFTELGDKALNRLNGTMLGDLIAQDIFPDGNNTRALGSITDRWSVVNGVLGNFSSTVTASSFIGSGATLTSIPETAIVDGALLARVAAAETITGIWDFDAPAVFSANGDRNIIIATNTGNGIAMRVRGRTDNNLGTIDFTDNTEAVAYGSIGITPGGGLTYVGNFTGHTFSGPVSLGSTLTAAGVGTFSTGIVSIANPSNATALQIQGRSADNTSAITFNDNTNSTQYARIDVIPGAILQFNSTSSQGFNFTGGLIRSNTSQPGFLAYNSVDDSAVSGTNTVELDTEVYDHGGVFNATTDTFTAPITGIYHLCATVDTTEAGVANYILSLHIVTSNRAYKATANNAAASGVSGASLCVYADMDAADTAIVQAINTTIGGAVTITGSSSPLTTFFSGRLVP